MNGNGAVASPRAMQALLEFCQSATKGYAGVNVTDWTNSWRDGLALCALLHRFAPEKIQFESLSREHPRINWELGTAVACAQFGMPRLQEHDLLRSESAMVSYLSQLHGELRKRKATGKPPKARMTLFKKSPGKSPASALSPRARAAAASPAVAAPTPSQPQQMRSPQHRIVASSGKQHLLRWCQNRAQPKVPAEMVTDFRNCWKNGLVLCAIAHSYYPNEIPFESLQANTKQDWLRNVTLAFEVLHRCGNVPMLMDAPDIVDVDIVEEQSLMTYLSTVRRVLDSKTQVRSPPPPVMSPTSRRLIFQGDEEDEQQMQLQQQMRQQQQRPAAHVVFSPTSEAATPKTPASRVQLVHVAPAADLGTPVATPASPGSATTTPVTVNRNKSVRARSPSPRARVEFELPAVVGSTAAPAPVAAVASEPPLKKRSADAAPPSRARRQLEKATASDSNDLSRLPHLTMDAMRNALKDRYAKDEIYTWCGETLVSVNPLRPLGHMYGLDVITRYASAGDERHLPPHIFALGAQLLRDAKLSTRQNQVVVISGESGAGKTEATKLLVSFFSHAAPSPASVPGLQNRMLASSVVLEALGNARTLRNDNSSRFGKLFRVSFGPEGAGLLGASVQSYLLELSRVTVQAPSERNYHIFYQMCAGASKEERALYKLGPADQFAILKTCTAPGPFADDAKDWVRFKDSLAALGMPMEEQQEMFRVLSAILHLGNVGFCESAKAAKEGVKQTELARGSEAACQQAALLLGLEPSTLSTVLTKRIINVTGRESTVVKPLSLEQAKEGRDTLCRVLYSKLFDLIIGFVNGALAPVGVVGSSCGTWQEGHRCVSLLDLFGFENFDSGNHFEQMCVNYANEKMHQIFLDQVLKHELQEYEREGIRFTVPVPDNALCVELFEDRVRGIIAILDEQCKMGNATAQSFVQKLDKEWSSNPHLTVPKLQSNKPTFTVNHYAEPVAYSTHGFRARNVFALQPDVVHAVAHSGRAFLSTLFEGDLSPADMGGRAGKISVGRQFRASLQELAQLCANASRLRWVRCLKPNKKQRPGNFDEMVVQKQLAYTGMLSVATLRQDGLPVRLTFAEFYARYAKAANKGPMLPGSNERNSCLYLVDALRDVTGIRTTRGGKGAVQVGATKVFLSQDFFDAAEDAREEKEEIERKRLLEEQEAAARRARQEEERRRLAEEQEARRLRQEQEAAALAAARRKEEEQKKQQQQPPAASRKRGSLEEATHKSPVESRAQQLIAEKPAALPSASKRPHMDPVVPSLEGLAASLEGSWQGAAVILLNRRDANMAWCDSVLKGTQGELAAEAARALSAMKFGRYADIMSPPDKAHLQDTLRKTRKRRPVERTSSGAAAEKDKAPRVQSTSSNNKQEEAELPPLPAQVPPLSDKQAYKEYMRLKYEHQQRENALLRRKMEETQGAKDMESELERLRAEKRALQEEVAQSRQREIERRRELEAQLEERDRLIAQHQEEAKHLKRERDEEARREQLQRDAAQGLIPQLKRQKTPPPVERIAVAAEPAHQPLAQFSRASPPRGRRPPSNAGHRTPSPAKAAAPAPRPAPAPAPATVAAEVVPASVPICGHCHRELSDQGLQFAGVIYDRACFGCVQCGVKFAGKSKVIALEGKPYCETCGKARFLELKASNTPLKDVSRTPVKTPATNKAALPSTPRGGGEAATPTREELKKRQAELRAKEQELLAREEEIKAHQEEQRRKLQEKQRLMQQQKEARASKADLWAAKAREVFQTPTAKDEEQKRRAQELRALQESASHHANSSDTPAGGDEPHQRRQSIVATPMGVAEQQRSRQSLYGMDAELHEKVSSKFSDQDWLDALHWVETVSGLKLEPENGSGIDRFWNGLRNGVGLCTVMNKLLPGSVPKIESPGIALREVENIKLFLKAAADFGVPSHETFTPSDLYDAKYLSAVLINLHALSRVAQSAGCNEAVLGIRVATAYGAHVKGNPRWSLVSNQNYYGHRKNV